METNKKCCLEPKPHLKGGIISGIIYGLIPHSFCLAFALFSVIGAVTASVFLKKILLIPNIFVYLILVSFLLASISIYLYLKKTDCLCKNGFISNWRYILIVYITTITINLVFFYGVIPALANMGNNKNTVQENNSFISLKVNIPCTGHSFLIIEELSKLPGISEVKFVAPDIFKIKYNGQLVSPQTISSLEIFNTFKMTVL